MEAKLDLSAYTLHTARLALGPLVEADVEQLLDFFNDPDVGRWLLDGQTVSHTWVLDEVTASAKRFVRIGCGLWAMRSIGSEPVIGVVGFRHFFEPPELQLLYAIHPSMWGRGLATEAATAVIDYAFRTLAFDEVRAATDALNTASIRVLERLGMEQWKVEEARAHPTLFFRLTSGQWWVRAPRGGPAVQPCG